MFHVSTLMAWSQWDTQQLERKKHIGNDNVVIVFQDGPDCVYPSDSIRSQMIKTLIVVQNVAPYTESDAPQPQPVVEDSEEEHDEDSSSGAEGAGEVGGEAGPALRHFKVDTVDTPVPDTYRVRVVHKGRTYTDTQPAVPVDLGARGFVCGTDAERDLFQSWLLTKICNCVSHVWELPELASKVRSMRRSQIQQFIRRND
ncbi:hypothetical protein KIPB_012203 [Kipferlia bialata]|uniref:Rap-GAP domain-containing protein n=1 Tax=Kipferlia bialata TaxID=797122 RepID=A0A9K3GMV1_9EUKA|nr:hypothetical protein KIPB_012203 [Kipferlia bialata]|eukprot:g12203.t1